ncbi:MAG: hypothetical protein R3C15_05760 [Thermoleophilia bacterium]
MGDPLREWAWPLVLRADVRVAARDLAAPLAILAVDDESGRPVAELVVAPDGRVGVRSPPGALAAAPLLAWSSARLPSGASAPVAVELELAPGGWVSIQLDGREVLALDGLGGGTRPRPAAVRAGVVDRGVAAEAIEVSVAELVAEAAS